MSYDDYGYDSGQRARRELKKVTDLLCLVCRYLESKEALRKVISENQANELDQFWRKEKGAYAKREAKEAARRAEKARKADEKRRKGELKASALAKLTDEEKRALGIKIPKQKPKRAVAKRLGIK